MPPGIDPNLFASLAQSYVGGIRAPSGPEQAGHWVRADSTGTNLAYSNTGPVDVADITGYGGADDGVTNTTPALTRALAANPSGCTIRFPRRLTGVYYFSDSNLAAVVAGGFVLDVDDGVVFQSESDAAIWAAGLRCKRPVGLHFSAYRHQYNPYASNTELQKSVLLHAGDLDQSTATAIDLTTAGEVWNLPFPSGAWVPDSVPAAADHCVLAPVGGAGYFQTLLLDCADGDEVSAAFSSASTFGAGYTIACAKLADGGYAAVFAGVSGGGPNFISYHGSGDPVTYMIATIGNGAHASYWPEKSLLTLHVHNRRSFSVLINGVELYRVADTGSDIVKVGFGAGCNSGACAADLWYPARVHGKKLSGKKPLKIYIVGDSITTTALQGAWPYLMLEALESSGGARVDLWHSQAIAGQNSGDQYLLLQAAHAAGTLDAYNDGVLCIQIGVNDIQAGYAASVLVDNLTSMIGIGAAHRMTIVAGLPTLYYGTAQAGVFGGIGQNAVHYADGAMHRAAALRTFAQHGVKVVPVLDELGPVLADYLATGKDPIVRDNIHPTAHASRLMGYAYARAILGALQPAAL